MKLETSDCIAILSLNEAEIREKFQVSEMSLFGSTARGDQKDDSDVDLLVKMPPKITLVVELKDFLENKLNKEVDIIRKRTTLSEDFLNLISKDVISIFWDRKAKDFVKLEIN